MRTKTIFSTIFAYLCMLLVFVVASCKPEEAVDETKNKLHEDPVKAVFTLQEGTIKGGKPFSEDLVLADFQPSSVKPQQIVWQITSQRGWHVSSEQTHFQVHSIRQNPAMVYHLSIEYYNSKGEKINHQFFDLGQDKIHQHFFSVYKTVSLNGKQGRTRESDKSKLPLDYCYTDYHNGVDLGKMNPIGFDGLLQIVRSDRGFNLSVDLLHAAQSKYDRQNRLSPFYLPAPVLTSTGLWDITVSLPFDVDGQAATTETKPLDNSLFQPKTVEIQVYEGHLHGPRQFHQNMFSPNNEYIGKSYQLTYTLENDKWVPKKENDKWVNVLGNKDGFAVYAFSLRYFDEHHHDITAQIVEQGADQHYQHFFTVNNIKPSYGGVEEATDANTPDFFNYTYCDTNPWNKTNHYDHATFNDDQHPIGLKGYFAFKHTHKQFTLSIRLMRARETKLVEGKPSLFCQPTKQQQDEEAWMPNINIPVRVYMDVNEKSLDMIEDGSIQHFETMKLSDLSVRDQGIVTAFMKAFDLKDFKVALAEFYWLMNDTPVHDGKGFWF